MRSRMLWQRYDLVFFVGCATLTDAGKRLRPRLGPDDLPVRERDDEQ